ncbi:MAG TPA: ABC transporter permease [Caldilineaceae bacterium]|nr:ABC transporter permease [Caldilineaceae bacterium]
MAVQYLIRRLVWMLITLFGISLITFLLIFAVPVDPARALVGDRAQGVSIEHVRQYYGLDLPLHRQYLNYMGRLLRGDLGESYYFRRPVAEALLVRLPATVLLACSIMLVASLIGIPLGILGALRANSLLDRGLMTVQLLSISLPTFFVGLLLMYLFAFQLKWLPTGGYGSFRHLILPTLAVAVPWSAWYAIFLRSSMLEVISADYIRTARAKGLAGRTVAVRHALRNALIPVLTMIGMDLASLLTGIALVEYIFNWPGIGLQTLQAAQHLDVPLIMGSVLLGAVFIGIGSLLVDFTYTWLDPRMRLD